MKKIVTFCFCELLSDDWMIRNVNTGLSICSFITCEIYIPSKQSLETQVLIGGGQGSGRRTSAPKVLRASKLVDQRTEEDESVLEKHGQPRSHLFLGNNVSSKQDPDGGDERTEHHHKAQEEPEPGPCASQTALPIRVASHLAIGYSVDHEEGDGGEDSAGVEGVVHFLLSRVRNCGIDHDPPTTEEQNSCTNGGNSVPPLSPVHALTLRPAKVIQEACHDPP